MNEAISTAVDRVVEMMYERVGDDITVDDMARTALYSKFHFSRAFRHVTGVSPGRFLAALRFQEAKRLLTFTSLSVAEISNRVGYSSLGTFSARFKRCVGVTPTEYRRHGGRPAPADRPARGAPLSAVRGRVSLTGTGPDATGPTFVGLYPHAVPAMSPVRATLLGEPGPYTLEDVPDGTWYVWAQAAAPPAAGVPAAPGRRPGTAAFPPAHPVGSVGSLGPITVHDGAAVECPDLHLRPMRTIDFPLLSAPATHLVAAADSVRAAGE